MSDIDRICCDLNTFDPLDEEIRTTLRAQADEIDRLRQELAEQQDELDACRQALGLSLAPLRA